MLNYVFWMSRLPAQVQVGVLLFGFFGYRALFNFADKNPAWQSWIWPIIIAYVIFALMTWIADPLFNLLLRLDRHGRYALSDEQIQGANALGLCLLIAVGSLIGYFATGSKTALSFAFLFGIGLIPVSAVWKCQTGWPRTTMALFTAAFFASGLLIRVPLGLPAALLQLAATLHIMTIYVAPWLANGLQFARVTR